MRDNGGQIGGVKGICESRRHHRLSGPGKNRDIIVRTSLHRGGGDVIVTFGFVDCGHTASFFRYGKLITGARRRQFFLTVCRHDLRTITFIVLTL